MNLVSSRVDTNNLQEYHNSISINTRKKNRLFRETSSYRHNTPKCLPQFFGGSTLPMRYNTYSTRADTFCQLTHNTQYISGHYLPTYTYLSQSYMFTNDPSLCQPWTHNSNSNSQISHIHIPS